MIIILVKFLWSWIDDAHDTELNSFLLVVDMINNFLFSFFTWFTDAQHKEDAGDEIHDEVQAPLLSDLLQVIDLFYYLPNLNSGISSWSRLLILSRKICGPTLSPTSTM